MQTVAVAAQQLTVSFAKITRQVSHSAEVATRASADAQGTDQIVRALAEGAQRIGDVDGAAGRETCPNRQSIVT